AREHRRHAQLTWLGSFGPEVPAGVVAAVEVTARLAADTTGDYTIGCSGVGRFHGTGDGKVLFDDIVSPAPSLAAPQAVLLLPQWHTTVPLTAGEHADIVVRYDAPVGLDTAKLELNVEAPAGPPAEELARAVELARSADVAVVVVGTTEEVESEGFDR